MSVLRALVVPFVAGTIMAAAGGAAAFGLLATLNPPSRADKLTAALIGRLDGMNGSRVLVTASGHRALPGDCMAGERGSQIRDGSSTRLLLVGTNLRRVSGTRRLQRVAAATRSLAACPRFLANGLSARLFADRLTLLKTTRQRGRSVDVFAASSYSRLPFVQLVVNGKTLVPTEIRFVSRRLIRHSQLAALRARRSGAAPVSSCPDPVGMTLHAAHPEAPHGIAEVRDSRRVRRPARGRWAGLAAGASAGTLRTRDECRDAGNGAG